MPSNLNRVERVFVGEVVADVDRQQEPGRVDAVANPGQRGPLVPVEVGPKLDEHAPAGHPEAVLAVRVDVPRRRSHRLLRCDLAVVHRDGKALVLDSHARNPGQTPAQFGGGALEDGYEHGGRFVLVMCAVRPGQLEPVAACVPDAGYAYPAADVREVTTAQDGHGAHRRRRVPAPRPRRRRAWPQRDPKRWGTAFRRSRGTTSTLGRW